MTARRLDEVWQQARARLQEAGVESAEYDARVLLAHVLGCGSNDIYLRRHDQISAADEAACHHLIDLRARRRPLQQVTGEVWFHDLHLRCDQRALIPRSETEQLVSEVLLRLPTVALQPSELLVDVGCGSGAIALALASHCPSQIVVGTDLSPAALSLAAENRQLTGLDERVWLLPGSYLEPLLAEPLAHRVAVVVSNPPYIRPAELATLAPELGWEPALALRAPTADGLGAYRTLWQQANLLPHLRLLAAETGYDQAQAVADLWRGADKVEIVPDLAGIERFVIAHV